MARNGRTLPARRQREAFDDSVLIRSAESLGRMIGSLQRQLDGAAKKVAAGNGFASAPGADGDSAPTRKDPAMAKTASANKGSKPSRAAARTGKGASKSGATKVRSTADRASKRASKSAAAKKTAGRGRAAARPSKKNGAAS